jgi:hypothetical protein
MKELMSGMLILAVVNYASAWAADNDELWKITTKTDMPDMPMPEVVVTVCLPKGEVYKPVKVPHQKNCKISDVKLFGDKTTWQIHCSGREGMNGSGEVTRTANTMKGTVDLSSKSIHMTQSISGKRVGSCQAK